jgi:putative hydrolase of the HAD superfamily
MEPFSPSCIFFDLDETLYPPGIGVWEEIGRRINRYLLERIGIPKEEVDILRQKFFIKYGTTLSGLRAEYEVDPQEYLQFVHDIPLDRYLQPDIRLRQLLDALPQRKYIFSNADRPYILRVLSALGISDQFHGIVDIYATVFFCKPMEQAYRIALEAAGSPRPETCLYVDDLPRNLPPASRLGIKTVLVHNKVPAFPADFHIDTIYQLADLVRRPFS